jgi:hypothetical protein
MDGVVPKLGVGAILLGLDRSCQVALPPFHNLSFCESQRTSQCFGTSTRIVAGNVGYRGHFGKHMLGVRFSQFDPKATS